MLDFDVGFRAHTADSFLLHGQKKRTKEKAARMTCPANNAGFPVLLARFGAQPNSHKRRAQTGLRLTQSGLRCSAVSYGGVKSEPPGPRYSGRSVAEIRNPCFILYRCRDGFYFDVGFRAHTAGSFLLCGQKKRTKEKAARIPCPANNAGYPVLLTHFGAQPNSHKRRAQTGLRLPPKRPAMLGCVLRG